MYSWALGGATHTHCLYLLEAERPGWLPYFGGSIQDLMVGLNKERGAKNDSWAPGFSNREEEEELEEKEEVPVHFRERDRTKELLFRRL